MDRPADMPTLPAGAGQPEEAATTIPRPGHSWGKFVIEKRLGGGGQAEVFQAFDRVGTAGHVALKVPTRPLPAERIDEWVQTEAGALVKVQHENIVPVLEAGQVGSYPYVATALVEGLPLHEHVRANPPPLRRAARWVLQLAEALQAAHTLGIVHRDLKPLNVIVTPEGRPVLIDFGVASLVTAYQHEQRRDGSGTFPFMAPEQARGAPEADHRVDVFGLGAILKYLLVGRGPYERHSSADSAYRAAREGRVVPITNVGGSALRRRLCRIANRALDPDPAGRYQTAAQMATALRRALSGPRWLMAAGAAALLAALAAGGVVLRGGDADSPPEGAVAPAAEVAPAAAVAPAFAVLFQHQGRPGPFRTLEADLLPLLTGDRIRVNVALPEPLYAYVIGLSADGKARRLYPPPGERPGPVQELHLPAEPLRGFELEPPGGTQTLILLAAREPFREIDALISRLEKAGAAPRLVGSVLLEGDGTEVHFIQGRDRRLGAGKVTVDTRYLDVLLKRMKDGAVLVRAVAFPVYNREDVRAGIERAARQRTDAAQGGARRFAPTRPGRRDRRPGRQPTP